MSKILDDLLNEAASLDVWPPIRKAVSQMLYEAYADGMGDGYDAAQQDSADA